MIGGTLLGTDKYENRIVQVDANSGEVLHSALIVGLSGGGERKKFSITKMKRVYVEPLKLSMWVDNRQLELSVCPLLLGGIPYVPVKTLACRNAKLFMRGGKVNFLTNGGMALLSSGSPEFQLQGKYIHADSPVKIVNERMYVPLSIYRETTGNKIEYITQSKAIKVTQSNSVK